MGSRANLLDAGGGYHDGEKIDLQAAARHSLPLPKSLKIVLVAMICLGSALMGTGRIVNAAASSKLVWNGYEIVNTNSNKCLDSMGSGTGPRMHQWTCVANANQIWALQPAGFPYAYTIRNIAYNKCLDVPGGSHNNGVQLQLYPCNNTGAQLWMWDDPVGGSLSEIVNWDSGKCIDVYNWSQQNGGVIDQWTCGAYPGQPNQHWWYNPGPLQP